MFARAQIDDAVADAEQPGVGVEVGVWDFDTVDPASKLHHGLDPSRVGRLSRPSCDLPLSLAVWLGCGLAVER